MLRLANIWLTNTVIVISEKVSPIFRPT